MTGAYAAAVRWVSMSELVGGAAAEPLLDDEGTVVEPLLVVDLGAGTGSPDAVAAATASERILVGVAPGGLPADGEELARALDLTLAPQAPCPQVAASADPMADAAALHDAAAANPQAALALRQVLRATEGLAVGPALDVESFAYSTLLGGGEFRAWLTARGPRPLPPSAPQEPVLLDRTGAGGAELRITLNRPERRNAYGREVRDALVAALHVAEADPTIERVVLTGAGPSFCAGGDLDEFGTAPDGATAHLVRTRGGAGALLHRLASRVEARLHGSCVGAGIELPAFARTVVASPGTTFRLPEVGMGLIPGAGGTVSIPRRIGRWRTLRFALTGAPLDVDTALVWGLVDRVDTAENT